MLESCNQLKIKIFLIEHGCQTTYRVSFYIGYEYDTDNILIQHDFYSLLNRTSMYITLSRLSDYLSFRCVSISIIHLHNHIEKYTHKMHTLT